jgi:glycosyltransferase involved in cell wall biosynthesis
MRICIISREYPPDTSWGGIGAYSFLHANTLAQLGHDVEVISLTKEEVLSEPPVQNGADPASSLNIPLHRAVWGSLLQELGTIWISVPYSHYLLKTSLALWKKFLAVHKAKPFDVVEAPEHLAEAIFPALTRIAPLVVRLHTPQFKIVSEGFHNLTPSFDQHFIGMLERLAILSADVVTCPSRELAHYVCNSTGLPIDKVSLISNPIDSKKFTPDGEHSWPADGRLTVLFAGRLEERKGVYQLIDAIPLVVRVFKSVRFILLGQDTDTAPGKSSVRAALARKLNDSGCGDAVQFVDHIDLADMPGAYRSADICVVPSLYDNAPYTVLEAMSSAKPLVATRAGGIPEYVEEGKTGLIVEPGDSQVLADALLDLLNDEEKRLRFGQAARERVLAVFSKEAVARETVLAYEAARIVHTNNEGSALYRKSADRAVDDFNALIYAYHRNLYDLIYVHSLRFRIKHWLVLAMNRPKFCAAKMFVSIGEPVIGWLGNRPHRLRDLLDNLAEQLRIKEQEIYRLSELELLVKLQRSAQ